MKTLTNNYLIIKAQTPLVEKIQFAIEQIEKDHANPNPTKHICKVIQVRGAKWRKNTELLINEIETNEAYLKSERENHEVNLEDEEVLVTTEMIIKEHQQEFAERIRK